jgi:hypothetical protein
MCRIERLQDFARLLAKDSAVKSVEARNSSPRRKQQKRMDGKSNSSPKMVSAAKPYFYTLKLTQT